jgi:hypothetical protein
VVDEVLARAALLACMALRGEVECAAEEIPVDALVVGGDVRDELFDQLLVSSTCFENGHGKSVLPRFSVPGWGAIGLKEGIPTCRKNIDMRRRKDERKALKLARLLVSLDDVARADRPLRPRRRRVALSTR